MQAVPDSAEHSIGVQRLPKTEYLYCPAAGVISRVTGDSSAVGISQTGVTDLKGLLPSLLPTPPLGCART